MTQSIASDYAHLFVLKDWNSGQRGKHSECVTNPHFRKPIVPYVPSDQLNCSIVEKHPLFSSDYSVIILTELDPKDLANFSEVSKGCYLALKSNSIWDIQFQKSFSKAKIVDQSFCSFNAEDQFKIVYKRFNDELRPFATQNKKNNEILVRLRGPNGRDGELDRLWKRFQALSVGRAEFLSLEQLPSNFLTKEQQDQLKWAEKANRKKRNKERLFEAQKRLCIALGGPDYNGTPNTLAASSNQGQILQWIEVTIPTIFSKQKKIELMIRHSANAKNIIPASSIAKAWIQGDPILLFDLRVVSQKEHSVHLNCTPDVLEKVGLSSLDDLRALGLLNEPFVKEIELPKDVLSMDESERHKQNYERKEFCTDLLNTLSKKIEKRIKESKPYNTTFFESEENPWVEYRKCVEEITRNILEKCDSPANLFKNYEQILNELNALIAEFNEQDRQYQTTKLCAYIHQQDIRPQWHILNDQGITTLTQYVAQNPGVNLFKMGIGD